MAGKRSVLLFVLRALMRNAEMDGGKEFDISNGRFGIYRSF